MTAAAHTTFLKQVLHDADLDREARLRQARALDALGKARRPPPLAPPRDCCAGACDWLFF